MERVDVIGSNHVTTTITTTTEATYSLTMRYFYGFNNIVVYRNG